ncbi:MAG: 2-dehydro-3-deoxyglucarate aldolase, partial [Gemmatimonadetes bacterium]|nr:2-dehydro-3-deoxyglucarate aldolase [Gemmatimonadota bacterium]
RRCAVVVRTASSDIASIKPILDAGAPGIVVPQVASAEEVQHVVDACRYPPQGQRGFGPFVPTDYGRKEAGYVERANRAVFVAVMIERKEAVDAIDEIVAIDGLDSIVIGPMDLSGSMNVLGQADHPDVVAAMEKAIAAAKTKNMPVGSGMPADPAFASKQAARGIQWMQVGVDLSYLASSVDATMKSLGEALRDA